MTRQLALVLIFAAVLLIGLAYALAFFPGVPPIWGSGSMVLGISVLMVAMMILGSLRDGALGRLWLPFVLTFLLLLGGFGAALVMPAESGADTGLWMGLPPRAAVVLYGVGLIPLLLIPLAYAFTFDEQTLSDGDLERVLAAARRMTLSMAPGEAPVEAGGQVPATSQGRDMDGTAAECRGAGGTEKRLGAERH